MKKGRKKMTVDLNQYELDLFAEAMKVSRRDSGQSEAHILNRFVVEASRAVIRNGNCPGPLALDARYQTYEETAQRAAKTIPMAGCQSFPPPSRMPPWLEKMLIEDEAEAIHYALALEHLAASIRYHHAKIRKWKPEAERAWPKDSLLAAALEKAKKGLKRECEIAKRN
jgi:hypothetical protein